MTRRSLGVILSFVILLMLPLQSVAATQKETVEIENLWYGRENAQRAQKDIIEITG